MASKPKTPTYTADFWTQHPDLAAKATSYLQSQSSDAQLTKLAMGNRQFNPAAFAKKSPNMEHWAGDVRMGIQNHIGQGIQQLTSKGLSSEQAHEALLTEMLAAHAGKGKTANLTYRDHAVDPLLQQAADQGNQNALELVTLQAKWTDPLQAEKKNTKTADTWNNLFAASFGRSKLGQIAYLTASTNPQVAAQAARTQVEKQTLDTYHQVADKGGIADAYDAYLNKQIKKDPLTVLGLSRASLGIPEGTPLTGDTIRQAALANLQKERDSLIGPVQTGTQIEKFVQQLEATGPVGKRLAKYIATGAWTGGEIAQGYEELAMTGNVDPLLSGAASTAQAGTAAVGKAISSGAAPVAAPVAPTK